MERRHINLENLLVKSETRSFLMRKLITICPVCKKMIYGRDIEMNQLKKGHWPVPYIHEHEYNNFPVHSIRMYIDSGLAVRHLEVLDF